MLEYKRIHVLEGTDDNKSPDKSKECENVIFGISLIKTLIMSLIFAMAVTI